MNLRRNLVHSWHGHPGVFVALQVGVHLSPRGEGPGNEAEALGGVDFLVHLHEGPVVALHLAPQPFFATLLVKAGQKVSDTPSKRLDCM